MAKGVGGCQDILLQNLFIVHEKLSCSSSSSLEALMGVLFFPYPLSKRGLKTIIVAHVRLLRPC
jgi:hypothetical protein